MQGSLYFYHLNFSLVGASSSWCNALLQLIFPTRIEQNLHPQYDLRLTKNIALLLGWTLLLQMWIVRHYPHRDPHTEITWIVPINRIMPIKNPKAATANAIAPAAITKFFNTLKIKNRTNIYKLAKSANCFRRNNRENDKKFSGGTFEESLALMPICSFLFHFL